MLLISLGLQGVVGPAPRSFGWIHLVALGWITLTALSVLLFVIPQFTDARWRGESVARAGILVFGIGSFGIAIAFWENRGDWIFVAAAALVAGLTCYIAPSFLTLLTVARMRSTEAAIARAVVVVLTFLAVTAILGLALAGAVAGRFGAGIFAALSTHAHFGALGWLTLLIMGVSTRTIGPIAGQRSPRRTAHIASASLVTIGAVVLGAGLVSMSWLAWIGAAVSVSGLVIYAADVVLVLLSATVRHRPPQAFVFASMIWLIAACVLGILVLDGAPSLAPAYAFVALVGWVGGMVVGHLHHIGVRLLATVARGDNDETAPEELLSPALSWTTFVLFQLAIAIGIWALVRGNAAGLAQSGALGLAAWVAMTANALGAWRSASGRVEPR